MSPQPHTPPDPHKPPPHADPDWVHVGEHLGVDPRTEILGPYRFLVCVRADFIAQLLAGTWRDIPAHGEVKPGKRARAEKFIRDHAADPRSIAAPVLRVSSNGAGGWVGTLKDGRHRFRILADNGAQWITCHVMWSVMRALVAAGLAKHQEPLKP